MKTLTIVYPETVLAALNVSTDAFEAEAKMALASKLYELGRLTSGQAAEIVGISRVKFLLTCQNYGVPSVNWDEDEIMAEFDHKEI